MGKNDFLTPKAVCLLRSCADYSFSLGQLVCTVSCWCCVTNRLIALAVHKDTSVAAIANILCWHLQISNRIKSKGLQKLRWFCQMCQKQCRDENGFKCHLNSESHKRQMEIFGQNADRVIAGYSEEFEADFMQLMRTSHPNNRVAAKNVYNEFIADKYHIHMNSTKWFTLTEFVKYLGKTGIPRTLVIASTLHFSGSLVTSSLLVHKPICFS